MVVFVSYFGCHSLHLYKHCSLCFSKSPCESRRVVVAVMESVSPQRSAPQVHYRDRWAPWERDEVLSSKWKHTKKTLIGFLLHSVLFQCWIIICLLSSLLFTVLIQHHLWALFPLALEFCCGFSQVLWILKGKQSHTELIKRHISGTEVHLVFCFPLPERSICSNHQTTKLHPMQLLENHLEPTIRSGYWIYLPRNHPSIDQYASCPSRHISVPVGSVVLH